MGRRGYEREKRVGGGVEMRQGHDDEGLKSLSILQVNSKAFKSTILSFEIKKTFPFSSSFTLFSQT